MSCNISKSLCVAIIVICSFYNLNAQGPMNLKVYKTSCVPGNEWSGWVSLTQPCFYYDFPAPFTMAEVRVTNLPYGGSYDQSFTFSNSNFCNQWPYALATGRYTWNVRVYYYAMPPGVWTWTPETWGSDFYVDVTAPNPPVISESHCGGSHTETPPWTTHTSPYFTWSDPGDAHSGVSYYQVASAKLPGIPGSWTNVTSPYEPAIEGQYNFYFRSVDNAGNASSSYVMFIRIDATAPPAPSVYETHCLPHGIWTAHTSPSFAWAPVLDAGFPYSSGVSYYQASVNDGEWFTVSSVWEPTFGTGQYNFRFRAVDGAGLAGSVDVVSGICIDDSPPDPPVITENHCGGSTSENPPWSAHTSPNFVWSIPADAGSGILPTGFQVSVNSGEWASVLSGWHPVYTNGSYTFDFQSIDRVGHTSTSYRIFVRIHEPVKIYVKQNAAGSNNGTSWTDAFTDLQSALSPAVGGDTIWVAAGTYKPSADKTGNSSPADPRTKTFNLVSYVPVYGGFAGTETKLKERNPVSNVTILSGDIGTANDNTDNCYCVVTGVNNSTLDGFTVTGGNGNGTVSLESDLGGGISSNAVSNVKTRNCIFQNNYSKQGGAAGSYFCTDSIIFSNCTFKTNTSDNGGAIGNWNTRVYVSNCIFSSNNASSATGWGSAIFNWGAGSTSQIINSTFHNNISSTSGGAISNRGAVSTVTNCILWGNSANDIYNTNGGSSTVTYSCVEQSGYAGSNGNISINPEFVDAPNGDFHLCSVSPCIDAGNGTVAPKADLDKNPRFDNPLVTNTGTGDPAYSDMGVYECSMVTEIPENRADPYRVYPNPSEGVFYIEGTDIQSIVIYDVHGRIVLDNHDRIKSEFTLENQHEGLYFIKILSGSSQVMKKIVIN